MLTLEPFCSEYYSISLVTRFAKTVLLGTQFLTLNFDFKGRNSHKIPFLLDRPQAISITTCSSSLLMLRNLIKVKVSVSYAQKKQTM